MTTVAAIALGLPAYDPDAIHRSRIARGRRHARSPTGCCGMTRAERAALPVMHPGRVDVIGAGALVLRRLMDRAGLDEVVVSASTTSSTASPGRSPAEEPADRRTLDGEHP